MKANSLLQKPTGGPRLATTAAELRLANIVNSADDAIIGKTLDGVITSWNPGAEKIFGYTAAEAVGRPMLMLFPPERVEVESLLLASIARGESVRRFETVRVRKDGQRIDVSITMSPIIDGAGRIIGTSKIAQDITERKQVERALEESKARFKVVVENLTEGLIIADLGGNLIHWNPAALRMYGFSNPEEGKRGRDEFAKIFELSSLDGKRVMQDQGPLARVLRGEPVRDMKLRIRRTDIEWERVFNFNGAIARYAGDQSLAFLTLNDITEQTRAEQAWRKGEERYHTTLDSIMEGCQLLGFDWRYLYINPAAAKHNRRPGGEMLGRTMTEVWPGIEQTGVFAMFQRTMTERIPLHEEVEFTFPDGGIGWFDVRSQPVPEGLFILSLDITESKRAELALRQKQVEFKDLFDNAPAGYHEVDGQGRITRINETELKMLGYTAAELLGEPVWKISANEDVSRRAVLEKLKGAVPTKAFERRLKRKDGSTFEVLIEDRLVTGPDGGIAGLRSVIKDITERKAAEAALQESEERFRTMANSISHLAWIAQADGFIFWYNQRWYEYTGTTPQQMEGWGWQSVHDPQKLPLVMAQWTAAIAAGQLFEMEFPLRGADGKFRAFLTRALPLKNAAGAVVQWFGTNTDVEVLKQAETAIRESEERFRFLNNLADATRTLADPAQIMAVTARMLGQHLRASRCAYADVEQDGEQFTIQHDYTDGCASTVGNYQLSLFGARAVATLQQGETLILRNVNTELRPGEGAEMFNAIGIQAVICCPLVKSGGLRAMMAVHQTGPRDWKPAEIALIEDVVERCWATIERRLAEEKVIQLNAELEQRVIERTGQLEAANKELEAFSYSVSHDLRAPLRAVNGFAAIVLEDFAGLVPEEARRHLERIRNGGQQMGKLIDDLLDFSRLSRLPLTPQKVDHLQLVQNVLEELKLQREDRLIELRTGNLPPSQGDPALLKQVWVNLLANAIKYTRGRKPAVIEINGSPGDGELVYSVKDNGTGFDMKYAGKLFGVFQRLHRADEFEGTGVGLAIVQRIVHRHGGRVWTEAEPDRGATFYFTLPKGAKS